MGTFSGDGGLRGKDKGDTPERFRDTDNPPKKRNGTASAKYCDTSCRADGEYPAVCADEGENARNGDDKPRNGDIQSSAVRSA